MTDDGVDGRGPTSANRETRRSLRARGALDTAQFLKVADKFIDVANRENRKIEATDLHLAFLWAAARYNAHVAKAVVGIEDHERVVAEMTAIYQEMLRQHLGDPSLDPGDGRET